MLPYLFVFPDFSRNVACLACNKHCLCVFLDSKEIPLTSLCLPFRLHLTLGLGCGLVFAATLTITCQYFDKRRGLALGIVTTGTARASPPPAALEFCMLTAFMSAPLLANRGEKLPR